MAAPAPLPIVAAAIKKKKPGFRVGVAARDGDSATDGAAGGTDGSGGGGAGVLAGLSVHVSTGSPAAEGDGDHLAATAAAAPRPGGAGALLAGLRVHAAAPGNDATDTAVSSSGGGGGGLLAGLSLHGQSGTAESDSSRVGAVDDDREDAEPPALSVTAPPSHAIVSAVTPQFTPKHVSDGAPAVPSTAAPVVKSAGVAFPSSVASPQQAPPPVYGRRGAAADVPPAASAVQLTPTDRARSVLATLADAAAAGRTRLADLKHRLRSLADADRRIASELASLADQAAAAEAAQDDALRAEAFDRADALNATIDAVRSATAAAVARRSALAAERTSLEAAQEAAFDEAQAVTSEAVVGLRAYLDDRRSGLATHARASVSEATSLRDRIGNEEEQLRLKEAHVARDRDLVAEETAQVASAIAEQTNDLEARVRDLRARHASLVEDVAELERKLAAKRAEEKAAASALVDAEGRIAGIRAKFTKQDTRLAARRAAVAAESAECEAEARAIAAETAACVAAARAARATAADIGRQVAYASIEVSVTEALRTALLEAAARRREWAARAGAATAARTALETAIDGSVRALRAVQARRAGLEAAAAGVRGALAAIDGKLPTLSRDKAAAVAERKFKEAGRLTAELKRLGEERDAATAELSVALSAIDGCDAEVAARDADVAAARAALDTHERAVDEARAAALREAIGVLRAHMRTLGKPRPRPAPAVAAAAAAADAPRVLRDVLALEARSEYEVAAADGVVPQPVDDSRLGIEVDKSTSRTAAQAASLDMLAAEADVLMEELSSLAAKHGLDATIPEPPPDGEEEATTGSDSHDEVAALAPTTPHAGAPAAAEQQSTDSDQPALASSAAAVTPTPSTPMPASPGGAASSSPHQQYVTDAGSPMPTTADAVHTVDGAGGIPFSGDVTGSLNDAVAADAEPDAANDDAEAMGGDVASTADAAPSPPPADPEVLRLAELSTVAAAVASLGTSIHEKEAVIAAAVEVEDWETADAAQVDIDAFAGQREHLLTRAAELGVASEDELMGYARIGGNAADSAAQVEIVAEDITQVPTAQPTTGFAFLS